MFGPENGYENAVLIKLFQTKNSLRSLSPNSGFFLQDPSYFWLGFRVKRKKTVGNHYGPHGTLVHKLVLLPQAMKTPNAKAAVDKKKARLEKLSAWRMTTVKSKKGLHLK